MGQDGKAVADALHASSRARRVDRRLVGASVGAFGCRNAIPTRVIRFLASTTLGVTNLGMDGRPIAHLWGWFLDTLKMRHIERLVARL